MRGMELELGLGLGLGLPQYYNVNAKNSNEFMSFESKTHQRNKRSFSQAFQDYNTTTTTISDDQQQHSTREKPLLVSWGGKPNKEDEDDREGDQRKTSHSLNMGELEENQVVGWPPINSWRKNLLGGPIRNNRYQMVAADRGRRGGGVNSSSSYVKVKMEGVAIGRKIDLQLYDSYETLKTALINMFAKYHKCDISSRCFCLTYEDRYGDWMLAGDVPWKSFMETARRLEIVKTAGG